MKKRFLIFLITIIIAPSLLIGAPKTPTAFAVNGYKRVITHDTPLFSESDGKGFAFYLPYSYYVKVLETVGDYTHVECYGTGGTITLDGFIPSDMLFLDGLEVLNPYPQITVVTANATVLYSDLALDNPFQYLFKDRELNFYGNAFSNDGQPVYCVGYNNRIGYVLETDLIPFTVPIHPNELTFLNPPDEKPQENGEQSGEAPELSLDGLRIAVIVCLISAGVIALLLSFKRKPTAQSSVGYYDENDYG